MLSERLIKQRKKKKKTQQEMADYLGITRPAYTAYERGNRQPDYETLQKLADFFDVSLDYLLGRTDDPTPPEQKLDEWGLSEEDMVFFKDFASLSEEDKQKAIEHIRYLKYLAEKQNKGEQGD